MRLSRSALLGASLSMPLVTGLVLASPAAFAQTSVLGGRPLQACKVSEVELAQGTSLLIDFTTDIRDASVTNPATANVYGQTARRFSVSAIAAGRTDATFYDVYNQCDTKLTIRVTPDFSGLEEMIAFLAPNARVQAKVYNNSNIILTGQVTSRSEADQIYKLALSYVTRPEQVRNSMTVPDSEQVMLNVKVIEVNRTEIKQLGFNTQVLFGQLGMDQFIVGNTPSYSVNGGFQGGGTAGYQLNTTSQPVATSPVATLFQGLGTSSGLLQAAQAVGIVPSQLAQFATNYLQGTGGLTAAQQTFAQQYLTGLLGSVTTDVTEYQPDGTSRIITLNANGEGITSANLPALTRQYLNGDPLPVRQQHVLNAIYKALPNYSNAIAAPESTYVDRTNPANSVATGRAGDTGVNQARALIEAFERDGLIRTVAESNLVSVSGEAAKYLSGGEFPVPTGRDNQGMISLEYKPYGVGLGFTPTVLSGGLISLKISAEVSALSSQGAATLPGVGGAGSSTVIPGLTVSRTSNVVELPSGGAMMIAGLVREETSQSIDKVPGVGDIPLVGALGRSRDVLKTEKELVIIVTPYLVKPQSPSRLQTPADGLRIASDSQTNGLGYLNQPYKAPPGDAPTALANRRYEGPLGHVID